MKEAHGKGKATPNPKTKRRFGKRVVEEQPATKNRMPLDAHRKGKERFSRLRRYCLATNDKNRSTALKTAFSSKTEKGRAVGKRKGRAGMDAELEQFKGLNLSQYAASYGYQLDHRASSRNSAVMRHANGDKIIIARQGPHWVYFSVRDDTDHGTILDFVKHRDRCSLGTARQVLRQWSGSPPPVQPIHYAHRLDPITRDRAAVLREYAKLTAITQSAALLARGIPADLQAAPRFAGAILQDERRNACFPHRDRDGVSGWEIKNHGFTGFSKGGEKGLWFSRTQPTDNALVIAESALDALSYAALYPDDHARYFSTGGSLNPKQPALMAAALEKMPRPAVVILATDNDPAGHELAATIQSLAPPVEGLAFKRPLPTVGKDWNDQLKAQRRPASPCPSRNHVIS